MKLLLSELSRFRSRRAVVLLLAGAFVVAVVISAATLWDNRPLDERDLEQARENAQMQVDDCERHPRWFGYRGQPERCQEILERVEENPEEFQFRYPAPYDEVAVTLPTAVMAPLAFLALLAGTTFVGADIASGAMSTTLLFRPDRWQVWAAKVAATVLWTALVAAVILGVCLGALALTATDDPRTGMGPGDGAALAWRGVRVLTVVVVAAAVGAAITSALRSTIATLGVVLGYLLIGEALLRSLFNDAVQSFLASNRVFAFVRPRLVLFPSDGERRSDRIVLDMWPSAVYLGVVALVIGAVCLAVFRQRDVP